MTVEGDSEDNDCSCYDQRITQLLNSALSSISIYFASTYNTEADYSIIVLNEWHASLWSWHIKSDMGTLSVLEHE
jgi:hypothetical protein